MLTLAPRLSAAAAVLCALAAPAAAQQRPVLAGAATYGLPGGDILVHYATTGTDAVPPADADASGVPDFVEQVAQIAEDGHDRLVQLGFRPPLADTLGGDARTDIYLMDLVGADGTVRSDSCTGNRCIGYAITENDYAGYNYPSITEALRSVVPHELFHLVQNAYATGQPVTWAEGSAVWAVEQLYGDGNADFERFLPSFLPKSFRPFERPPSGFGDLYAYGAALWPYYLSERFDPRIVVEILEATESATYLDAFQRALEPRGSSFEAAFIEFTRWNLFTKDRAAGGPYPAGAAAWPSVPLEQGTGSTARIFVEGLSAMYLPVVVTSSPRVAVRPPSNIRLAGLLVPNGGGLADGIELVEQDDGGIGAVVPEGGYVLVLTGLTKNTIATAVEVELTQPLPDDTDGDDDGGCSAGGSAGWPGGLALALLGVIRRRVRKRVPPV